jgi:hypothetical protein
VRATGDKFYIYENWQAGPHKAVIHRGACGHCNNGQGKTGGYSPLHARWHGPYDDLRTTRHASDVLLHIVNRSECRCVAWP